MKASFLLVPVTPFLLRADLAAESPGVEQSQTPEQAFETSGPVDAKSFVPAKLMTGALHSVGEQAPNNGLQNLYQLSSGGRTLEITTTPLLIQRINEILAALGNRSKAEGANPTRARSANLRARTKRRPSWR